MASAAKVALMLMLVSAMVMAAQAGTEYVSVKNEYCQPIKLNGVEVAAGDITVVPIEQFVRELFGWVTNADGEMVSGTYTCPSSVTSLSILGTVDGLVVKVTDGLVATLLSLITVFISAAENLTPCL